MCSVTDRLSLTGSVLAMQVTAVKPPAAAAMVPVATVSLYSWPGSRRWTCMSISPGATTSPAASRTVTSRRSRPSQPARPPPPSRRRPPPSRSLRPSRPSRSVRSTTSATKPSSISRSWAPSMPWLGSISLPFVISRRPEGAPGPAALAVVTGISGGLLMYPGEQVKHGHPHRDAVGDLLEDHRVRPVGDLAGDLDAAVHRPRMHDDHVLGRAREPRAGQAEDLEVLLDRRDRHASLPLELDAQHHDHVGAAHRLRERVGDLDPQPLDAHGHHGARPGDRHPRSHLGQQVDVRAHHPAVLDVADDRHLEPGEAPLVAARSEE